MGDYGSKKKISRLKSESAAHTALIMIAHDSFSSFKLMMTILDSRISRIEV